MDKRGHSEQLLFSLGWKGHWYDAGHLKQMPVELVHTAVCFLICHRQSILGISGNFSILSSLDCGVNCSSCHPSNRKCFSKSHKIYDDIFYFSAQHFKLSQDRSDWIVGPNDIFSLHVIQPHFQSWEGYAKNLTSFYMSLSKCLRSTPWHVGWQAYLIKGKGENKREKKKRKNFWIYF